jgi:large subunit ribosomal protein L35
VTAKGNARSSVLQECENGFVSVESPFRSTRIEPKIRGFQLNEAKPRHLVDGLHFEGIPMPKMKTHKGTKKRFRLSANGKVMHRKAGTSHLAFRLTKKRRRNLRGTGALAEPMAKRIAIALNGYSN